MGAYLYLVGAAIVVAALVIFRRGGNSLQSGDISNSAVIVGTVTGKVSQKIAAPADGAAPKERGDRVAWVIAIIGVAIAAAQLIHDLVK